MTLRYLYGPVTGTFADQNLRTPRAAGPCLAFGDSADLDVRIKAGDSWEDIRQRFPDGWEPDFVVLNLAYATVPAALWTAPIAKVALATDWHLLWHYYRARLPQCDLVLTDRPGAEALARTGINARPANLCGCEAAFVEEGVESGAQGVKSGAPSAEREEQDGERSALHSSRSTLRAPLATLRDIDILFIGNLNPVVQSERAPWLQRLARLSERWRVLIRGGVFGEPYRCLLRRARIVFQFSARGKLGRRAFEAANAGALIFQEEGNREFPEFFRDREECIYYRQDNLEQLLDYYLEHEDERLALAEAARQRARTCRFEDLWQQEVERLEADWPAWRDSGRRAVDGWQDLQARAWQALTASKVEDGSLVADLERAVKSQTEPAQSANLAGCMVWRQGRGRTTAAVLANVAAEFFRQALVAEPGFALAGLNLAEALEAAGRRHEARDAARRTLDILRRSPDLDPVSIDGMPWCQSFDPLHVQWERAAVGGMLSRPECKGEGPASFRRESMAPVTDRHAETHAKRELILSKLHGFLAGATRELPHFYESALHRPDLPGTRAALGDALVRAGRPEEGCAHFHRALTLNPFDRELARAYHHVLGTLNDVEGRRRLTDERRLLARVAPQVVPMENWFAGPKPKGNELASIIILCCNQLAVTRECLGSLLRQTRRPYELILVDNGSTDSTRAYLEEIRGKQGPVRVEVIRNETNLGFPRACNQALAKARGEYIVFLNNDTLLTPGWLDGLVALSLHDWPHVGMVGPVTNGAPAPQGIAVDYVVEGGTQSRTDRMSILQQVEEFAAKRRREFAGKMMSVPRLTGFCLLVRRQVLDRLGPLDERFGIGFFEDDDLCLRAREAGHRLLMAQDVFVHHVGNQTFNGMKMDIDGMLQANFELLRDKWGKDLTAGYYLPRRAEKIADFRLQIADLQTPSLQSEICNLQSKIRTSLCMIVRNEEHNLPDCLRSVEGLFDEIIVVDTGSTDGTIEVARRFGAKVFEFPWVDSFGAARNEALRHATGKWIMWLDADDRLDAENRERLRKVLANLGDERDAYAIKVRSVLDAKRSAFRLLDQVRIFRNLPEIRWDYRIHEQILPAVNRAGGSVRWTDIIVDHVGYQDAGMRRKKLERNLRLLELDDAERQDDSFSLFNLGWTLLDLGRGAEALPRLERSLEHAKPDSSILRKLYHLLTTAHKGEGRGTRGEAPDEALKYCRLGLEKFPDDAELLLEEGLMLRERGELAGAEQSWLKLFEPRQGKYFASEEVGLRGFRSRQLLAEIYLKQERLTEAEIQWRAALDERLDFEPAWQGLTELYLRLARWPDLEELLQRLETADIGGPKVGWLRARGCVQRKEYSDARKLLAGVIAADERALGPRVLLSQALLQEGRDWDAAERALQDILEIDPDNKDALHNLKVLKRQRSRAMAVA